MLIAAETPAVAHRLPFATRWLAPSLSDILFAALLIWMMLFTIHSDGTMGLLSDSNTGYHIRTGDFVLEHKAVPHRDIFSFSKSGEPWFAWEWLSAVLFAVLYQTAGMKGLVVAAGTVIALANMVLLRHMVWRGTNFLVVIVILHFGVGASSIHYSGPAAYFHAVVSRHRAVADRRGPHPAVGIHLAPGSARRTLGQPARRIRVADRLPRDCRRRLGAGASWVAARRYTLLALACLAATGINPYGFAVHRHVVSYLQEKWIAKLVQEFQSPSFQSAEGLSILKYCCSPESRW